MKTTFLDFNNFKAVIDFDIIRAGFVIFLFVHILRESNEQDSNKFPK